MITPYLVKPYARNNAAPSVVPSNAITQVGPDMNYGAMEPQDGFNYPNHTPERQESQTANIFSSNVRRLYDHKAPENLLEGSSGFGYILN